MKEIISSLYPDVLLHGTNIRTAKLVFKTLLYPTTIEIPTIGPPTTYSAHHKNI